MRWILKVKRWDGSESVVNIYNTQAEAEAWARKMNHDTQSNQWHAEQYDTAKGLCVGDR